MSILDHKKDKNNEHKRNTQTFVNIKNQRQVICEPGTVSSIISVSSGFEEKPIIAQMLLESLI